MYIVGDIMEIITKNPNETRNVAALLAKELRRVSGRAAVVIALSGNLGSGKTTFVQGCARVFGVKESILSPTFVLMKIYTLHAKFKHLVHIDCYRIASTKELVHLGFLDLLRNNNAIILIEWAEKIKKILPQKTIWIYFDYIKKSNERKINISHV